MRLESISSEFAYEFFMQIKKASEKEKIIKPKVKSVEEKSGGELPFIRNMMQEKPMEKALPQKVILPKLVDKERESAIKKIERLMEDSSVESIECYGPGENIKVKRGKRIADSEVSLSEEEIKEVFYAVEKEHGKAMNNIFKTNFGKFIFNGIRSKFIGSRFVLEKKNYEE